MDNGYRFSDISILCRSNDEIFIFSQLLSLLEVNYNGETNPIKTISDAGLTLDLSSTILALTEFLRWEQNPKNGYFPVKMLYYLKTLGRITMNDFTAEVQEILAAKDKTAMSRIIDEKYGLNLTNARHLDLNLYHFCEHYLQEFSVEGKETDFLFNYLGECVGTMYKVSRHSKGNPREPEAHNSSFPKRPNVIFASAHPGWASLD